MNRYLLVVFSLLFLFILSALRLFDLAVFQRPRLLAIARSQHQIKIEIAPKRGLILDRNGRELATTVKGLSLYAIPSLIRDKEELAGQLSRLLKLDKGFLLERLSRKKAFIWIKRKISREEEEAIRRLDHPHLGFLAEHTRFYPHEKLLSHVLGFTNIDNEGLEGLELAFNRTLKGEEGMRVTRRDALGREIIAFDERMIPPVNGKNLVLTIDYRLQNAVERELDKAFDKWNAKGAVAVMMNPMTGEILAMASRPAIDPNRPQEFPKDFRRNRAVTDFYEPGSIFKVVTACAALSEGSSRLEDHFDCENGAYQIGGRVIHDVHPYGRLAFPEVIIKSSNIGTVKIAQKLGLEKLYRWIKRFGFGERTRIELAGEAQGIIRPVSQWSRLSIAAIPFGQEVTATALQMIRALSVIANGGYLVEPYLVKEVRDEKGVVLTRHDSKPPLRILDPLIAERMRKILTQVVDEGTGVWAKIPGIPVAGKTGTAQKIKEEGGGYSHSNFIGSFMGFAPSDGPMAAMIVMVDDPHPMYYGGVVAAPVFREAVSESLRHLGYYVTRALMEKGLVAAPPRPALLTDADFAE